MLKPAKCVLFCFILILFMPFEALSKTCCLREVATEVYAPYDTNSKVYKDIFGFSREFLNGAWDQVFIDPALGGGSKLGCPTIWMIELNVAPELEKFNEYFKIKPIEGLNYMFYVKYNVTGTGEPPYGYEVKLEAELVDLAHGSTVKSAQSSWRCAPREAGECIRARIQNTENVAKSFQPLDKLIYDYERIPETLDIELEKDSIPAGDEMTITLKNIKDADSKPSQPWQRILIKAEKGKILNGAPLMEYRVFEVGSGNIQIQYRAPKACKNDKIIIMNSCYINPNLRPLPEREIAAKGIKITCPDLTAEYDFSFESKSKYKHESGGKGTLSREETKANDELKAKVKASYSLISAVKREDRVKESYRLISSSLQEISGQGKFFLHSQYYRKGRLEREAKCQGEGLRTGGKIHHDIKVLHITYDAKTGNVREVGGSAGNIRFNLAGKCTCVEHDYLESRVWQWDCMPALLGAKYIDDHSGGYYTILGLDVDIPEGQMPPYSVFQKVSGNREDGVISGEKKFLLESPDYQEILRLNYQFKKIKR